MAEPRRPCPSEFLLSHPPSFTSSDQSPRSDAVPPNGSLDLIFPAHLEARDKSEQWLLLVLIGVLG